MSVSSRGKRSIGLVPFGELDPESLSFLPGALGETYGMPASWGSALPLPRAAYNRARMQYLAGAFLESLSGLPPGEGLRLLGITDEDLFAPGLNFVFGQAAVGGRACVISLARLRPASFMETEGLFRQRVVKEAVHELGHTFGLGHCPDPGCVMRFSNCLADTDRKGVSLCPSCRAAAEKAIQELGKW